MLSQLETDVIFQYLTSHEADLQPEVRAALTEIRPDATWSVDFTDNSFSESGHRNLYRSEMRRDFREWLSLKGVTPDRYGEFVGSVQYRSVSIFDTELIPAGRRNKGWRVRLMGFPSIGIVGMGISTHYQGTQNQNLMGEASALIRSVAASVVSDEPEFFERFPSATAAHWDSTKLFPEPVLEIGDLNVSGFNNANGIELRSVRNTTVKKELSTFFFLRGYNQGTFAEDGASDLKLLVDFAAKLAKSDRSNPFSDLETFEGLRSAALSGDKNVAQFNRRLETLVRDEYTPSADLEIDDRTKRMVDLSIQSSKAVLLVGPPGTGKTQILKDAIRRISDSPDSYGFSGSTISANWVTAQENWTYDDLVLGQDLTDGTLHLKEGSLLSSIRRNEWLVIDEFNRADMDRVMGATLTWLSGEPVTIGPEKSESGEKKAVLGWKNEIGSSVSKLPSGDMEYVAGSDWRLLGTYNGVDGYRVFSMGQALARRFAHVPIPPIREKQFRSVIENLCRDSPRQTAIVDSLAAIYTAHLELPAATVGPGVLIPMVTYLTKGLEHEGTTDDLFSQLLSEAYVISVGPVVNRVEPIQKETLMQALAKIPTISADDHAWIEKTLNTLMA